MSASSGPRAPSGLQAAGRRLWRDVVGMSSAGRRLAFRADELAVLAEACRTADTIDRLADAASESPVMIAGSKGQQIVNPAVVELRLQRAAFASLLGRLAIPDAAAGWDHLTASQRARRAANARWSS